MIDHDYDDPMGHLNLLLAERQQLIVTFTQ
jgi:hypothetical protein